MHVVGIIAEYNPFHNGHFYQINKLKEKYGADIVIAIMSGNFVQRGLPAIVDKFSRTKMALTAGVDVVIELPACFAMSSAETFARGAINILNACNCIDYLGFGAECDDISSLKNIADILVDEPRDFKKILTEDLKKGLSFPMARNNALIEYLNFTNSDIFNTENIYDILNGSNNILAIEYLKSLENIGSNIKPVIVKRAGSSYNSTALEENMSSARAIREYLKNINSNELNNIKNNMPFNSFEIFKDTLNRSGAIFEDDLSDLLKYKLTLEINNGFTKYCDISEELSDRICNNYRNFTTFTSFVQLLKTKQYTYTRISRALLHIILSLDKSRMDIFKNCAGYIRILGLNKEASPVLKEMQKKSSIPIITKPASAYKLLKDNTDNYEMFKYDITVSEIYNNILQTKYDSLPYNEYKITPVIL